RGRDSDAGRPQAFPRRIPTQARQKVSVLTSDEREDMRVTTKRMTLSVVGVLALLAWATLAEPASIGPGAFVSPTTVTYEGLGLPFFNATPIVIAGDTYTTDMV